MNTLNNRLNTSVAAPVFHKKSEVKNILVLMLSISILFCFALSCYSNSQTPGEELYKRALDLEEQKSFTQSLQIYGEALPLLLEEGKQKLATLASEACRKILLFQFIYPFTAEELIDNLREAYPKASTEEIKGWVESDDRDRYFWDGEEHYFYDTAQNLKFAHMELMHADTVTAQIYHDLVLKINKTALEEPAHFWQPYQKPVTYRGTHIISVPRNELPAVGTYRIWFPLPINDGAQTEVTVESITPEKWLKQPPSITQDIGLLYMEIPMEELTEELNIQVQFTFNHYEQRFSVNPANVGEYEVNSALYQEYTRSNGNAEITPDIREKAKEIVGEETNPYYAARKIYDYIVNEVTYCLMPHNVLWPRTAQTESDYVHRYQRGDCGAQSMYFSALCRSLGIPARTTGGWQLFMDEFAGHFWAEFYLPNYGWIPVDTSAAQLAYYSGDLSAQDRETFIDYYFGNLDAMRCVVQKDTDEPLIPRAEGMVLLPPAIQMPTVEYSIPTDSIPDLVFQEHWEFKCEKLN